MTEFTVISDSDSISTNNFNNEPSSINNRKFQYFYQKGKANITYTDLNLLFVIITEASKNKSNALKISIRQLKDLMQKDIFKSHVSLNQFEAIVFKSTLRLCSLRAEFTTKANGHLVHLNNNLFNTLYVNNYSMLTIIINPIVMPLFHYFTYDIQFVLKDFLHIQSLYAKKLYLYLKQNHTFGNVKFSIKTFRDIFNVSSTYKTNSVNKRIINPSMECLAPYFYHLNLKKVRSNRQGRHIIGYIFTFSPVKGRTRKIVRTPHDVAMRNIVTNPYLSFAQQCRSTDYYKHLKLDTTIRKPMDILKSRQFFVFQKGKLNKSTNKIPKRKNHLSNSKKENSSYSKKRNNLKVPLTIIEQLRERMLNNKKSN